MKKKIFILLLSFSLLMPTGLIFAGRGGSSFAGGMAGGMIGGMMSGAMTRDSSGKDAKRDVEQLRREQQQAKMRQLRQDMSGQKSNLITIFVVIAFVIMFLAILGLLFMVLKTKKRRE
ncbi:hypothetical protein ACFLYH_00055 [Candidatus Dependentiae bacterium]